MQQTDHSEHVDVVAEADTPRGRVWTIRREQGHDIDHGDMLVDRGTGRTAVVEALDSMAEHTVSLVVRAAAAP